MTNTSRDYADEPRGAVRFMDNVVRTIAAFLYVAILGSLVYAFTLLVFSL